MVCTLCLKLTNDDIDYYFLIYFIKPLNKTKAKTITCNHLYQLSNKPFVKLFDTKVINCKNIDFYGSDMYHYGLFYLIKIFKKMMVFTKIFLVSTSQCCVETIYNVLILQ